MPSYFPVDGEVSGLNVRGARSEIGNCSLRSIAFHNNHIGYPFSLNERSVIRDVSIHKCAHWACSAYGTLFEDVSVADIRGGGRAMSFLWGCVFSRVTLRGWISGVLVRWQVDSNDLEFSKRFLAKNLAIYRSIEWALDITQAQFSFVECLYGVPSHLVRINPDRHFVLTRSSAERMLQRSDVWKICADGLLETNMESVVVVVGGRGAKLKEGLASALKLREEGLFV